MDQEKKPQKPLTLISFIPLIYSFIISGIIIYSASLVESSNIINNRISVIISEVISLFTMFVTAIALLILLFLMKYAYKYDLKRNLLYTVAGLVYAYAIAIFWFMFN